MDLHLHELESAEPLNLNFIVRIDVIERAAGPLDPWHWRMHYGRRP